MFMRKKIEIVNFGDSWTNITPKQKELMRKIIKKDRKQYSENYGMYCGMAWGHNIHKYKAQAQERGFNIVIMAFIDNCYEPDTHKFVFFQYQVYFCNKRETAELFHKANPSCRYWILNPVIEV